MKSRQKTELYMATAMTANKEQFSMSIRNQHRNPFKTYVDGRLLRGIHVLLGSNYCPTIIRRWFFNLFIVEWRERKNSFVSVSLFSFSVSSCLRIYIVAHSFIYLFMIIIIIRNEKKKLQWKWQISFLSTGFGRQPFCSK